MSASRLSGIATLILPSRLLHWLRMVHTRAVEWPPYRCVRFGSLRRTTPIHRGFTGFRGRWVDRYYIERFMARFSGDIRGTVLEIGDNTYTRAFGCGVGRSEVLDVRPEHTGATITADLSCADQIPSDIFDCIILTQTLQYIYDTRSAIRTIYRILRPGGVVLATFPGISQIAEEEMQYCGDYWRFTGLSARRLFEETFAGGSVEVATYGNVFAAIAFLHGLAVEELRTEELDTHDPQYELLISVRAVKPGGPVG